MYKYSVYKHEEFCSDEVDNVFCGVFDAPYLAFKFIKEHPQYDEDSYSIYFTVEVTE